MEKRSLPKLYYLIMIVPFILCACVDEHTRAAHTALAAYESKNARLLTFVPMVSQKCYSGCYTEICAVLELENKDIASRQVVFIRVGGMDDDRMYVRGEYASLFACQKDFNRG